MTSPPVKRCEREVICDRYIQIEDSGRRALLRRRYAVVRFAGGIGARPAFSSVAFRLLEHRFNSSVRLHAVRAILLSHVIPDSSKLSKTTKTTTALAIGERH